MNKTQLKYYQEKALQKGKTLLIEECNSIITSKDVEFLKEGKLIESSGKQYEALAVIKNCPVSKYTRNKNNRVYNRSLWEQVKKTGLYEGTYSLADHPVEEGSVKDTWGIWHGLNLTEEGTFSDLYLIEEKPVRILKAGGSLGTSTVGYGEFTEDGETVAAETYELERLGDIVLNPSQGTFATLENIQESEQKIEKKDNIFLNEITNKNNEIILENNTNIKEKSEDLKTMTQLDKFNVKNHVNLALKEAQESKNYKKTIDELQELALDIPVEFPDQKNRIESMISEIHLKMESEVKDKAKLLQEKVTAYTELETKYNTLVASMTEMTERLKKAENVVDKLGLKEDENKVCFKKEEAETMTFNLKSMQEDIKSYSEDRVAMSEDIKIMEEEINNMLDDIAKFKEERKIKDSIIEKTKKQLLKAESHIRDLEKILKEDFDYDFTDEEEVVYANELDGDEVVVDGVLYEPAADECGSYMGSSIHENVEGSDTSVDVPAEPAYDEDKKAEGGVDTPKDTQVAATYSEAEETDVVKDAEEEYQIIEETDDDEDEDDKKDDKDKVEEAEDDEDDKDKVEEAEDDKDDKEDEKKDDDMKDKDEIKEYVFNPKKAQKRIKENKVEKKASRIETTKPVMDFYLTAIKEKPFLKDFKKEILTSKSLMEAIDKVSSLKKKSNDMFKMKENTSKKNDGIFEYKFKF